MRLATVSVNVVLALFVLLVGSAGAQRPKTVAQLNEELKNTKPWAEQALTLPKGETLVVPVEFVRGALTTRPNKKDLGIIDMDVVSLLDAKYLHEAMYSVANRFPAEADTENFLSAWKTEKEAFLTKTADHSKDADGVSLTRELWQEFLTVWEAQALQESNKARFRDALLQTPLIVTGILLEFENKHIEAAMTGAGPASRTTAKSASSTTGQSVGSSHATRHHYRAMGRTYWSHYHKMARIAH